MIIGILQDLDSSSHYNTIQLELDYGVIADKKGQDKWRL